MNAADYEFDFTDALEDQALARLRYTDSCSGDETEEEEVRSERSPATSTSISLAVSTSISL
jgi:hypothetical protein